MIVLSQLPVCMVESSKTIKLLGYVTADIQINTSYPKTKLIVLENLFQYKNSTISFGNEKLPLFLCRLSTVNVESPCLSTRSKPNCKGITVKSCHYSQSKGNLLKQRPSNYWKKIFINYQISMVSPGYCHGKWKTQEMHVH